MKLKSEFIKLTSSQRLYKLSVPVIALTGGIATGKSTAAQMLMNKNIPVINADLLVKDIYRMEEVKKYIRVNHPEVIKDGEINFPSLRQKVFQNNDVKKEIEKLIYSHLEKAFMNAYSALSSPEVVVYDVPLLFERKMETLFDLTALVYAPRSVQQTRLMKRDNHLEDMADTILNQQIDIEEKKKRSDYVINNTDSEKELAAEVENFLRHYFI